MKKQFIKGQVVEWNGRRYENQRYGIIEPGDRFVEEAKPVSVKPVHREVPHEETYILVLRDASGKFKPAATPRVLTSKPQAEAVAEKMSKLHPGEEFFVFKAVAKSKTVVAAPTTTIEWMAAAA